MITSYRVHTRRRSQVEIDPPEGSLKADFRMVLALRSEELARTAYMGIHSPPMGLYRTAIVQGLSIVHGRGARRQIRPSFWVFILVTLKDKFLLCVRNESIEL